MGGCASTAGRAWVPQPPGVVVLGVASPEGLAEGLGPTDGCLGLPPRVKVVLLGDSGVGKSCLALRFTKGIFNPGSRATVGAAFSSAVITLPGGGARCRLELWDTAGQERYQSLAPLYYRGAHAAVIVYDITQRSTLESAARWLAELRQHTAHGTVLVLVGNKTDVGTLRQVSEEEGRQLADSMGALFVEASAATGSNVFEIFEGVAAKLAGGLPVSVNAVLF